jgi:hypothetical protein
MSAANWLEMRKMKQYVIPGPPGPPGPPGSHGYEYAGQTNATSNIAIYNSGKIYSNCAEFVSNPMRSTLNGSGYGVTDVGSIVPAVDKTLGIPTHSWNTVYSDKIQLGPTVSLGISGENTIVVNGNLIPSEPDVFSIGSTEHYWKDIHVSDGTINFSNPRSGAVTSISAKRDGFVSSSGGFLASSISIVDSSNSSNSSNSWTIKMNSDFDLVAEGTGREHILSNAVCGITGGAGILASSDDRNVVTLELTDTVEPVTVAYPASITVDRHGRITQIEAGIEGVTGLQGEKGDTGLQGEKGEIGLQGVRGETGLQGEKGETGLQGEKGDTGLQGEKGDTGLQGEKGDTGLQGESIQKCAFLSIGTSESFITTPEPIMTKSITVEKGQNIIVISTISGSGLSTKSTMFSKIEISGESITPNTSDIISGTNVNNNGFLQLTVMHSFTVPSTSVYVVTSFGWLSGNGKMNNRQLLVLGNVTQE